MNKLIDAGYSVAQYDGYLIVAINNRHRPYVSVAHIRQLLPDHKCISWYGKVKVWICLG
jgi:hypothetical protein